jgi:hypothetical protein
MIGPEDHVVWNRVSQLVHKNILAMVDVQETYVPRVPAIATSVVNNSSSCQRFKDVTTYAINLPYFSYNRLDYDAVGMG